MLEDGEISNSPKSAADNDDDDDGFVVDRSFLEVIENPEDVAEDDTAANVTGDSVAIKDISMASSSSGAPSEWAKKMRKRLLEESVGDVEYVDYGDSKDSGSLRFSKFSKFCRISEILEI
ncbi:hypothetical protein B9Z55_000464 [Caenorhabditis nigoni]|uniref:Uncharacterized protein n=1 Tax=Caenorhabditis nigoni TaxID=1611254 RepID=A0A2G5VTA9_9PELO|nr:hypothetical protein B9Z55_000464 [Caenorhabditis nigoni]